MSFVDSNPSTMRILRLHMDAAARQGGRSLPALILRLAASQDLLDVMTLMNPSGDIRGRHGGDAEQRLTIEIRGEEMRLRSFAASLANLPGIALATLDNTETLFRTSARGQ